MTTRVGDTVVTVHNETEAWSIGERITRIGKWPLDVLVRKHKVRRTYKQNKRIQWLCRIHAGWLNLKRDEIFSDLVRQGLVHEHFAAFLAPWDVNNVRRQIFNPQYCGTDSSTKPDKLAIAEALTHYEADLRTKGIEFPERDEMEDHW